MSFKVGYQANSILGAVLVIALLGLIASILMWDVSDEVGRKLWGFLFPVFVIAFIIWIGFAGMSLARNVRRF